ncbi:MAG: hypothetical protein LUE17_06755 [Planctomycetaceae bacterium]|nr:hypothetical protein [Planctomycetaceae bacterium]
MTNDDAYITIGLRSTLDEVLGKPDEFHADQLPFVMAGALYEVALKAREEMRRKAPSIFTVRKKKPWAERALTFDTSNKKQLRDRIKKGQEPSISIISKDEDLGPLLTDGGTRKRDDGKEMGVPIIGGGRKTLHSALSRKTGAQGVLKNNPRALVITAKNGRKLLITYPKKYKKGVPKALQHKALFHMRASVKIKPWWNARQIMGDAMLLHLGEEFEKACKMAMETRKGGK